MESHLSLPFRKCFSVLPKQVKKDALADYRRWKIDPFHKSLHFKLVNEKNKAWSVRAGIGWRAVGVRDGDVMIWFWVGSHADYDDLLINLRKSKINKTS